MRMPNIERRADMPEKPIAIFRTKSQILNARDLNELLVSDSVLKNSIFQDAKMQDLLGFKLQSGSDYEVVDVIQIKDNPKAFLELAFGERE